MKVRKFLAATSREALRQVREQIGHDAVILSNRKVADGVEIMALASADMSCLVDPAVTQPRKPVAKFIPAVAGGAYAQNTQPEVRAPKAPITETAAQSIISEIQTMRSMLQEQLATVSWGNLPQQDPGKMKVLRALLGAGFSPLLSRRLMAKLPAGSDHEQSLKQATAALGGGLRTLTSDEMMGNGGVYALVGPTGVGKTTTIAKLAARCVVRHGADKVALLTTDSYRIGGHEQLRIYGKLLGVPVRAIKDIEDLQLTLSELRNKHMVLIDTVGMSQRDQMVAEQATMLCNGGSEVKRMLLLNATSSGDTLEEVVLAYQGKGIHGCIITKVDEAASLGVALDSVIRHRLVLHYVANGQKVPEDMHLANAPYLLHRAFKPAPWDSAFSLQDSEFALVMAGRDSAVTATSGAHAGGAHG